MPQEWGVPVQDGAWPRLGPPATDEANVESFFVSFVDPHWVHLAPSQWLERTRISLSFPHFPQWNS
jgi:hypothetical protein